MTNKNKLQYWKQRALTDNLTGLRNREGLEEDLSDNPGQLYIFADIDDFKQLNDDRGHKHGDKVLKNIASVISNILSNKIQVKAYRLGGEEFLISANTIKQAEAIAQEVVNSVQTQTEATISAGIGKTIAKADQAMYKAKEQGKNQYHNSLEVSN